MDTVSFIDILLYFRYHFFHNSTFYLFFSFFLFALLPISSISKNIPFYPAYLRMPSSWVTFSIFPDTKIFWFFYSLVDPVLVSFFLRDFFLLIYKISTSLYWECSLHLFLMTTQIWFPVPNLSFAYNWPFSHLPLKSCQVFKCRVSKCELIPLAEFIKCLPHAKCFVANEMQTSSAVEKREVNIFNCDVFWYQT